MRVLLVIVLLNGMVPGLAEAIASMLGAPAHPHVASLVDDDGSQSDEHECGTTAHHCRCCVSQPVLVAFSVAVPLRDHADQGTPASNEALPPSQLPPNLFRPPNA